MDSTKVLPGVYITRPYSMRVLVPGAHPDDLALSQPAAEPPMPVVRPELRFYPAR